jgi:hypothetical protein
MGRFFFSRPGSRPLYLPSKAALAGQCGVRKTTVASTIGRSRDASRPSARERIHVQAAQGWIVWWSEGVFESKEGVQTHIVADLASSLRREEHGNRSWKQEKQGISCAIE